MPKGQPSKGMNAVARRKTSQSRKSNKSKKQVIKSVHVNKDEDDDVKGNDDGDDGDKNGGHTGDC